MASIELKITDKNGLTDEEIKQKINIYCKLIKQYNYNIEDFIIISMEVESDTMNSSFVEVQNMLVCIPKEFANTARRIVINFTWDNVQLLNEDGQLLCRTCGLGYDDIETPRFFVE